MKTKNTLLIIILLISLYSCKEEKKETAITLDNEPKISNKNNDCNYSEKSIGENSSNSEVELIGLFENLKNNGEHTYGYTLMVWKLEDEILGFFNSYDGGLEPNRSGPIVLGDLKNDSLHLKVWTKQNKSIEGWQKSDVHIYSFKGIKLKDKIVGDFTMFNCTKGENNPKKDEKIELISSDLWELKNFKNIEYWKEEYSYKLNYQE